jgi:nicotinamidase-related amidase
MHTVRLPRWAVQRGAGLNDFPALIPGRTALVNIDMQNAFVAEGQVFSNPHARDIVGRINALSQAMRAIGAPVIWTRQTYTIKGVGAAPGWHYDLSVPSVSQAVAALTAGSQGHALYPQMRLADSDIVIDKYRYGGFSCPVGRLHKALAERDVEMIVICGTLTNVCCESTAREAYMAGYKVIVVSDATAAVTDPEHNAALLNLRINFADVRRASAVQMMIASVHGLRN